MHIKSFVGAGTATGVLIAFLMLGVGGAMPVQAMDLERKVEFSIPPQRLSTALLQFAQQAKIQLVLREDLGNIVAREVSGVAKIGEALTDLLGASGLQYRVINDTSIAVAYPSSSFQSVERTVPVEQMRLAQHSAKDSNPESDEPQYLQKPQEVVVTGSRLSRIAVEGPQRVNVFTSEDIKRSGQATVSRFLATLPEVFNARSGESGFQISAHAPTVQLRGMPYGSTLVLLNGRRPGNTASANGSHFNLYNIPSAAIERIEILPEGASAVYGSDALAGVVNIILKSDFEGIEADMTYGSASGADERSVNMVWGRQTQRSSFSVVAAYQDRSFLGVDERALTADANYTRFGGPDRRVTACNPGNVYSVGGGNLPGLSSSFAAVPAGVTRPTLANFAATAGQLNRCALNNQSLIPKWDQMGSLANFSFRFSDSLQLFSSLIYSRVNNYSEVAPRTLSRFRVPAANPFNPFGQDVLVDFSFEHDTDTGKYHHEMQYLQALAGLRGRLNADWDWEVAAWGSREDVPFMSTSSVIAAGLNTLVNQTNPSQSIDLFSSGVPVIPAGATGAVFSGSSIVYDTNSKAANAVVRGGLFDLPAGRVNVAIGVDIFGERIEAQGGSAPFNYSRTAKAGYLETKIPLLRRQDRETLNLTAAVRYDDYNDFGSDTTSQFGVEWRPSGSLLVRAAQAESFVAPMLYFLNFPPFPFTSPIFDPAVGQTVNNVNFIFGGNPNLKAQRGESRSLGVVWTSQKLAGLQGSISVWELELADRLTTSPSSSFLLANEAIFPDRILRDPPVNGAPGRLATIDYRAMNLGELNLRGVDADVGHTLSFAAGKLSATARATWVDRYEVIVFPGTAPMDYLSKANNDVWAPRLRLTTGLGWDAGKWQSQFTGRYVSSFWDAAPLPSGVRQQLGDFWTLDSSLSVQLGELLSPNNAYFRHARATLGAVNLLDADVPFSMSNGAGYEPSAYDIKGRFVYVSLGVRW